MVPSSAQCSSCCHASGLSGEAALFLVRMCVAMSVVHKLRQAGAQGGYSDRDGEGAVSLRPDTRPEKQAASPASAFPLGSLG